MSIAPLPRLAALAHGVLPGTRRWPIAIRGVAAIIYVTFGIDEFTNHAVNAASFQSYGLPVPSASSYAVGSLEIVGGLLLALGLLTIPAAVALAGDMVGAIIVSGLGRGELVSLTLAPVLLVAMITLIVAGAGRCSLDERHAEPRLPAPVVVT